MLVSRLATLMVKASKPWTCARVAMMTEPPSPSDKNCGLAILPDLIHEQLTGPCSQETDF